MANPQESLLNSKTLAVNLDSVLNSCDSQALSVEVSVLIQLLCCSPKASKRRQTRPHGPQRTCCGFLSCSMLAKETKT